MPTNPDIAPIDTTFSTSEVAERPFVFMGGVGYDEAKNRLLAEKIVSLTGHREILAVSDTPISGPEYGTAVFVDSDGNERELPGKVALKHLKDDDSTMRYTRLQETRAEHLIASIENAGSGPVDAVFQSADASVGMLAMSRRPELFKNVVLLDPSSIIKLPPRLKYLAEELRSCNIWTLIKHRKDSGEVRVQPSKAEQQPMGLKERITKHVQMAKKFREYRKSGISIASYVSYQASMLHDIALMDNAPSVTILTSRLDHAYDPVRLLKALVNFDDVNNFLISNSRHGLSGKQKKLEQLVSVFISDTDKPTTFLERLSFGEGIPETYRNKILELVETRLKK